MQCSHKHQRIQQQHHPKHLAVVMVEIVQSISSDYIYKAIEVVIESADNMTRNKEIVEHNTEEGKVVHIGNYLVLPVKLLNLAAIPDYQRIQHEVDIITDSKGATLQKHLLT